MTEGEPLISAEEFERAYAARSGLSLDDLRRVRTVRRCYCDAAECEGWQSISHERAIEFDANKQAREDPPHLW